MMFSSSVICNLVDEENLDLGEVGEADGETSLRRSQTTAELVRLLAAYLPELEVLMRIDTCFA